MCDVLMHPHMMSWAACISLRDALARGDPLEITTSVCAFDELMLEIKLPG